MNTTEIRSENKILREVIENNKELFDLLESCRMIDISFLPQLLGLTEKTVKTRINKIRNDAVASKLVEFTGKGKREIIFLTDRGFSLMRSNKNKEKFEDLTPGKLDNARIFAFKRYFTNSKLSDEIKQAIQHEKGLYPLENDSTTMCQFALDRVDDFCFEDVTISGNDIVYKVTLATDIIKYKTLIKKVEQLLLILEITKIANFKGSRDKDLKIDFTILSVRPYDLRTYNKRKNIRKREYNQFSFAHKDKYIFKTGQVKRMSFEKYYKRIIKRTKFKIINTQDFKIYSYNEK